ncbi:MAG: hypothetical protein QW424_04905 [Candidatus Bathyarchaeia archaeon]
MDKRGRIGRISILLIVIVLILAVALIIIFSGIGEYITYVLNTLFNPLSIDPLNIALGLGIILLSVYLLLQIIKKPKDIFSESQRTITTIKCMNCDYITAREFEKGDYVLKEMGTCPKCGGSLLIYSIFREVKDEERGSEQHSNKNGI